MGALKFAKQAGFWGILSLMVLVVGACLAAVPSWNSLKNKGLVPEDRVPQKIIWRAKLFTSKAAGHIPELTWTEIWKMALHRGGFGLENAVEGVSVDGSVENGYNTKADRAVGENIFKQRCSTCHGVNAVGGIGPPLNRPGHRHGDSDLAIYNVLTHGIPGTAMVRPSLTFA